MKNSEYVCGIPVPNNCNRRKINDRFKAHSQAMGHILACAQKGTRNFLTIKKMNFLTLIFYNNKIFKNIFVTFLTTNFKHRLTPKLKINDLRKKKF